MPIQSASGLISPPHDRGAPFAVPGLQEVSRPPAPFHAVPRGWAGPLASGGDRVRETWPAPGVEPAARALRPISACQRWPIGSGPAPHSVAPNARRASVPGPGPRGNVARRAFAPDSIAASDIPNNDRNASRRPFRARRSGRRCGGRAPNGARPPHAHSAGGADIQDGDCGHPRTHERRRVIRPIASASQGELDL